MHQPVACDAEFLEEAADGSFFLGNRQHDVLDRDVLILEPLRFVFSLRQDRLQPWREVDLARAGRGTGNLREFVDFLLNAGSHGVDTDVGFVEDRGSESAFLVQQGEQQVFDIDLLITVANGERLGISDGVLKLFGEAAEVHT